MAKLFNIATILTLSTAVGASLPVLAEDAATPSTSTETTASTETTTQDPAITALIGQMDAAPDDATRESLLSTYLSQNPDSAPALVQTMKTQSPSNSTKYFKMVISVLSANPANSALVRSLTESNPDLVASLANEGGTVEPAGGPDDGQDFSQATTSQENSAVPAENPSQLNQPKASPSNPVL